MNTKDLYLELARRSGLSAADVRKVMRAFVELTTETLQAQDSLKLHGLGTFLATWRKPREIRGVRDARRVQLPGAWAPKFRPAGALKRALAGKSDNASEHTEAVRLTRVLVDDLVLYHRKPPTLARAMGNAQIRTVCAAFYGALWDDLLTAYAERVPASAGLESDLLADAFRKHTS